MRVVLGLGSNLGNRVVYIQEAIHAIIRENIIDRNTMRLSSLYESKAELKKDAPPEWDKPYLNMAIIGNTKLDPTNILNIIKDIETKLGREKRGVWAPREIDIDLLACDSIQIVTEELTLPHKYLPKRDFSIVPFAELWPDWVYPVIGNYYMMTAAEISSSITPKLKKIHHEFEL